VADRELPTLADPQVARDGLLRDAPAALEGLRWREQSPLVLLVDLEARRADGAVDRYVARLDFSYYPEYPPRVTFVDPETGRYDAAAWPEVANAPNIAFSAVYGDADAGMVCNSMFFEYYFWGGHAPTEAIRWNPRQHTFAATLTELKDALRPPYYVGPRR
jgi:hypothetical protein